MLDLLAQPEQQPNKLKEAGFLSRYKAYGKKSQLSLQV